MATRNQIPAGPRFSAALAAACAIASTVAWSAPALANTPSAGAPAGKDSTMSLKGGEEGTQFRTMTVEGEDRVHIDFARPALDLQFDLQAVPGLERGSALDVLDRTLPDLVTPMLAGTARDASPYIGRPWLRQYSSGDVARFRPAVKGIESWKLLIANSKGETVATYGGKGEPAKEITWDGRSSDGEPVVPGLTYSYVFEARDRAGNKRNFVGDGFTVSAYRLESASGPTLVLSGRELATASGSASALGTRSPASPGKAPLLLIEAASWLNQSARVQEPVVVRVSARTAEQAKALAARATESLSSLLLGGPSRVETHADVSTVAPEDGAILIGFAR